MNNMQPQTCPAMTTHADSRTPSRCGRPATQTVDDLDLCGYHAKVARRIGVAEAANWWGIER